MEAIAMAIFSVLAAYFIKRLDKIEDKIDRVENMVLSMPKRHNDHVE